MAEGRKYYVICEDNCRFESMTKEEILTAITEAVEQGEIHDVDTGFITKIKEQNAGRELKFWVGTQAQYNAISEPEENVMYLITDPQADAEMQAQIDELREDVDAIAPAGVCLWQGEASVNDTITVPDADRYNLFIVKVGSVWVNAVRQYSTDAIIGFLGWLDDSTPTQTYCTFGEGADNAWTVNANVKISGGQVSIAKIYYIYGIA